jgi:hypothetical protein
MYGTKPEYVSGGRPSDGHSHSMDGVKHISEQPLCVGAKMPVSSIKKGQALEIKAYYDLDKYQGMKREDGSWDEVMGIMVVFIRLKGK